MSPSMFFEAGGDIREDRRQQIVATHALNLRRNFLAALEAQECQSAIRVPAPARLEDRRAREHRLLQNVADGFRLQEVEDIGEREAVLLGERDVEAVVGGGGLQFEVEALAEALAKCESPGLC